MKAFVKELIERKRKQEAELTRAIEQHKDELDKFNMANMYSEDEETRALCCQIEELLQYIGVPGYEFD